MAKLLEEYIVEVGQSIVSKREQMISDNGGKDNPNDPAFVESLLEAHAKFSEMVQRQFGEDVKGNEDESECVARGSYARPSPGPTLVPTAPLAQVRGRQEV